MMKPPFASLTTLLSAAFIIIATGITPESYSDEQQPLLPGAGPTTVPAFPVIQAENQTCRLDLSDELFGGVGEACVHGGLDRSRCCPVLAAWLFAAHARSALEVRSPAMPDSEGPMMPDDSQKCVNSLQSSLLKRDIKLPQPNASCDAVLCFCGIRLHQIGSLSCPAAFNVSGGRITTTPTAAVNATPTAAVRELERNCRNSSYAGCTRCLQSLEKLKGGEIKGGSSGSNNDRAHKMFGRDCQLMGLTWLLAKNKTVYIPTVSAVLRAVLYSAHPQEYKCSPDQENMPLAVDSLQFQKLDGADSSSSSPSLTALAFSHYSLPVLLPLLLCLFFFVSSASLVGHVLL